MCNKGKLDKLSVRGKNVKERTERAYISPYLAILEVVTAWPATSMTRLDVKRTKKTAWI
jgi:hypothetical protein